jgi:hypothetical protein
MEEIGGGYQFGRVAVLGRGLLFGLDQNGSPLPFNLFLFSFPFFFSVFTIILLKQLQIKF